MYKIVRDTTRNATWVYRELFITKYYGKNEIEMGINVMECRIGLSLNSIKRMAINSAYHERDYGGQFR